MHKKPRKIRARPAVLLILGLILSPGPLRAAENPAAVIMALGDSITAGAPAFRSPAEFPPAGSGDPQSQYEYWIGKKHPEWKILNRGISGQTSAQILARLDRELAEFKPQRVLLMAGVNDIYRGQAAEPTIRNLQALYEELARRGIPVMALTILPYRGLTPEKFARLEKINQWIAHYATQAGLGFCDTYAVMHASSDPMQLARTADGLHPDAAGYQVMAEAINTALESWIAASAAGGKAS